MRILWILPWWVHEAFYRITGWVLVRTWDDETGEEWFSWSNDYPMKEDA